MPRSFRKLAQSEQLPLQFPVTTMPEPPYHPILVKTLVLIANDTVRASVLTTLLGHTTTVRDTVDSVTLCTPLLPHLAWISSPIALTTDLPSAAPTCIKGGPRTIVGNSVASVDLVSVLWDSMDNAVTKENLTTPERNGLMDVTMSVSVKMEQAVDTDATTGVLSTTTCPLSARSSETHRNAVKDLFATSTRISKHLNRLVLPELQQASVSVCTKENNILRASLGRMAVTINALAPTETQDFTNVNHYAHSINLSLHIVTWSKKPESAVLSQAANLTHRADLLQEPDPSVEAELAKHQPHHHPALTSYRTVRDMDKMFAMGSLLGPP